MMSLTFLTDNAAFEGADKALETARILRDIADDIEEGKDAGIARDGNGNNVGSWRLE